MHGWEAPRVEPATVAWLEALAEGDAVFTARFGVPVERGWAEFPETVSFALELAMGAAPEWGVHLFFDAADGALVGNGGWKGPPVSGHAEIGYAVAGARRGRGIATAAVKVLVSRAERAGLRVAVAHTLPHPSASTTVLARCGFTNVGDAVDPDSGAVWRWERGLGR